MDLERWMKGKEHKITVCVGIYRVVPYILARTVPCIVKSLCRETRSPVYLSPSAHCPYIESPFTSTEHCLIGPLRNDA
jgi:hypothetical protein